MPASFLIHMQQFHICHTHCMLRDFWNIKMSETLTCSWGLGAMCLTCFFKLFMLTDTIQAHNWVCIHCYYFLFVSKEKLDEQANSSLFSFPLIHENKKNEFIYIYIYKNFKLLT